MDFKFTLDKNEAAEFLKNLEKQLPGTVAEVEPLLSFAEQIRLLVSKDNHMRAVQAQCEIAMEIYGGVLALIGAHNGLSAEALCRTLFDLLISTTHLVKHPEKTKDFIDYAKLVNYRIMRKVEPSLPLFKERQKNAIAATEDEYRRLEAHFKQSKTRLTSSWHGQKVVTLIEQSGMTAKMYHVYYTKASNIAHGSPVVVPQRQNLLGAEWKLGIDRRVWGLHERTAYVTSFQLILLLFSNVIHQLNLGFEEELRALGEITQTITNRDIARRLTELDRQQAEESRQ